MESSLYLGGPLAVGALIYLIYQSQKNGSSSSPISPPSTPPPEDPSTPSKLPHIIPVYVPPQVSPVQEWEREAKIYRQNGKDLQKLPLIDLYFPAAAQFGLDYKTEPPYKPPPDPIKYAAGELVRQEGWTSKQAVLQSFNTSFHKMMSDIHAGHL